MRKYICDFLKEKRIDYYDLEDIDEEILKKEKGNEVM
jgi:hypothetical protein